MVRDAGRQARQHERVAVRERHQRDALLVDHLAGGAAARVEQRHVGRDRDGFLEVADLEAERELESIADPHLDALARRFLEAGQLRGHFVGAGRKVGERVSAVAIGGRRGHDVCRHVGDRDGDPGKPATLWIRDAPGDGAPEILCVST